MPKSGSDWKQGYGFQFWRCQHHAYRGDGAGGQFCVVMPDQDVVIAITADHANMQAELDAIWDHLLARVPDRRPPRKCRCSGKAETSGRNTGRPAG